MRQPGPRRPKADNERTVKQHDQWRRGRKLREAKRQVEAYRPRGE